MPRVQLQFNSITKLEPGVAAMFDDYLKQCVRDCQDRPGLTKSRSVKIEVTMAPEQDQKANVDGVIMHINVSKVIPKQVTKTFSLAVTRNAELAFNEVDPTTHHAQRTLDEANEDPAGQ